MAFNYDGMYYGTGVNMTFQNYLDPPKCQPSRYQLDSRCQEYFQFIINSNETMIQYFPPTHFMYSDNNKPYISFGFQNPQIDAFSFICNSFNLEKQNQILQSTFQNNRIRIIFDPITMRVSADLQLSKDMSIVYETFQNLFLTLIFMTESIIGQNESLALIEITKQIEYFQKLNNQRALGICYNNMGNIHFNNGRYEEAYDYYNRSIVCCLYELEFYKEQDQYICQNQKKKSIQSKLMSSVYLKDGQTIKQQSPNINNLKQAFLGDNYNDIQEKKMKQMDEFELISQLFSRKYNSFKAVFQYMMNDNNRAGNWDLEVILMQQLKELNFLNEDRQFFNIRNKIIANIYLLLIYTKTEQIQECHKIIRENEIIYNQYVIQRMESATSQSNSVQSKNDQHINKTTFSSIQNRKIEKHQSSTNDNQQQKTKNQLRKMDIHKLNILTNIDDIINRIYDQLVNEVSYKISLVYLDISKKKQKQNKKNKLKAKRFCEDIISQVFTKDDDYFGLIYSSLSDMKKCKNKNQNNFKNENATWQEIKQFITIKKINIFQNDQTNYPKEKKENILNQNYIQQSNILKDTQYKILNQYDGFQRNFKFNFSQFQRNSYQNEYNCSLKEQQSQLASFNQNSFSGINCIFSQNSQTICETSQNQLLKNFNFSDLDQTISQAIPYLEVVAKNKLQSSLSIILLSVSIFQTIFIKSYLNYAVSQIQLAQDTNEIQFSLLENEYILQIIQNDLQFEIQIIKILFNAKNKLDQGVIFKNPKFKNTLLSVLNTFYNSGDPYFLNLYRQNSYFISSWHQKSTYDLSQLDRLSADQIRNSSYIDFVWKANLQLNQNRIQKQQQQNIMSQSYFMAFNYDGMYYGTGVNMTFQNYLDPLQCQPSRYQLDSRCQEYFQFIINSNETIIQYFPPTHFMYSDNNKPNISFGFCKKAPMPINFKAIYQQYFRENPQIDAFSLICNSFNLEKQNLILQSTFQNNRIRIIFDPITMRVVLQSNLDISNNTLLNLQSSYLDKLDTKQQNIFLQQIKQFQQQYINKYCYQSKIQVFEQIQIKIVQQFKFQDKGRAFTAILQPIQTIDDDDKNSDSSNVFYCFKNSLILLTIIESTSQLFYYSKYITGLIFQSVENLTNAIQKLKINEDTNHLLLFEDKTFLQNFLNQSADLQLSKDMSLVYETFQNLFLTLIFMTESIIGQNESLALIEITKQIEYFQKLNNQRALGICYNNMGNIHFNNGRYEEAYDYYNRSIVCCLYEMEFYKEQDQYICQKQKKNSIQNQFMSLEYKKDEQAQKQQSSNINNLKQAISKDNQNDLDETQIKKNDEIELVSLLFTRKYNSFKAVFQYMMSDNNRAGNWDLEVLLIQRMPLDNKRK
ncbi:tetratricopeptide repeat protein (macronuclear) [Tetrahymena thermophila SB210]|uniref:Tetratricopeptide repeat protein n=1 Tax=Tetrahymena thermophila (strain SB210) TaxID=312017 RepID=W7XCM2_TETTS|nr:tetratricopeptide repeat protein [Tetrahymena thermophila SB210]EWS75217.1 tetratricopeptide repeat protein [Tetrahymena thermophila SB210]|eukprot:XP_012652208.1 tetratricopeptide repeat protein [Tetrahymena thermophila SB210]